MPSFVDGLRELVKKENPASAKGAADLFHGYYEPYALGRGKLVDNIAKIPSPYRGIIAAHQAWGMISSDGFLNIFEDTDEQFDGYVKEGLELFGAGQCLEPYLEARQLLNELDELSEEDDERLFDDFYDPIEDFHNMIGQYLLDHLN